MPEPLTVDQFIEDTLQDARSPMDSDFISKISRVRCTVHRLDEATEIDRTDILKTKKHMKSVISSGNTHADHVIGLCDYLEKFGQTALEGDEINGSDIAACLCKFSVVHRDLASMSKHLLQNMNSIIVFPLEAFMQGDVKADLKKPFEKALKEYESKYEKLRKEKLHVMKETNMFTPEQFTAEMTEDLDKERRRLQFEMCEYLIKVNELKCKRSADLLQYLIDFYHAQNHYFRDCVAMMDHFGKSMNDLTSRVSELRCTFDSQRKRLIETREEVKILLEKHTASSGLAYPAQPIQINRAYGTKKSGYLLKRSDGKVKRIWQRRRVKIADGELFLFHADETKPPVRLILLICQVKLPTDASGSAPTNSSSTSQQHPSDVPDPHASDTRNHFDLVSNTRTYNFQTEDDQEYEEWISVLNNAMQEEFQRAMDGPNDDNLSIDNRNNNASALDHSYRFSGDSFTGSLRGSENDLLGSGSHTSPSRDSLQSSDAISSTNPVPEGLKGRALHSHIQSNLRWCRPGNNLCADCGRPDPEWVSVNLGILICLECCGIHRELGVHLSRTQSLLMDDLPCNQLLLPRFIGNTLFNEVFESSLDNGIKPTANYPDAGSNMSTRRSFIKAKYIERRYITPTTSFISGVSPDDDRDPVVERFLRRDLLRAVKRNNLSILIQVFAERFDLMTAFQIEDDDYHCLHELEGMTALHVAVERVSSSDRKCDDESNDIRNSTSSLPLIQFIVQNSPIANLQRVNSRGDTALHHAARCGAVDAVKLLLQIGGLPSQLLPSMNKAGQTAHNLAMGLSTTSVSHADCAQLLELAESCMSSGLHNQKDSFTSVGLDPSSHVATTRQRLFDAVDQLHSVNLNSKIPNPTSALNRRHSLKLKNKILFPIGLDRSIDSSRMATEVFASGKSSSQRSPLATLPRKKGPAPRPPLSLSGHMVDPLESHVQYESGSGSVLTQSTLSNSEKTQKFLHKFPFFKSPFSDRTTFTTPKPNRTTASIIPVTCDSKTEYSTSPSRVSLGRSATERFSGLPKVLPFPPLTAPHSSTPIQNTTETNKYNTSPRPLSSDHIDVILDVLLEDKVPTPPPVPPKPDCMSSRSSYLNRTSSSIYSTISSSKRTDSKSSVLARDLSDSHAHSPKSKPIFVRTTDQAEPSPYAISPVKIVPNSSTNSTSPNLKSSSSVNQKSGSILLKARFDCKADMPDELTFHQGEVIRLVSKAEDDWWEGYIASEPWRKGLFPSNYVVQLNG